MYGEQGYGDEVRLPEYIIDIHKAPFSSLLFCYVNATLR